MYFTTLLKRLLNLVNKSFNSSILQQMLLLWPNKCFFFLWSPTKPNIIAHKKCLNFIKAEKRKKKFQLFFFAKKIAMTTVFDGVVYLFIHFLSLPKNYIFFSQFLWNLIKFFVLNVLSERGRIYTVIPEHIQYTQQTPWVLYIKKKLWKICLEGKKRVYMCKQIIWK